MERRNIGYGIRFFSEYGKEKRNRWKLPACARFRFFILSTERYL